MAIFQSPILARCSDCKEDSAYDDWECCDEYRTRKWFLCGDSLALYFDIPSDAQRIRFVAYENLNECLTRHNIEKVNEVISIVPVHDVFSDSARASFDFIVFRRSNEDVGRREYTSSGTGSILGKLLEAGKRYWVAMEIIA